jgi:L-ribulose-5-phosphate 3-epimerase
MALIGIMQGRLLPPTNNQIQCFPRDRWEEEFEFAAKADLDCIEWIYDLHSADMNPILTKIGVSKIRDLSAKHDVHVLSLCADYFMDKPLINVDDSELRDRLSHLKWLLTRCQLIGINRVVLPFVDNSRIRSKDQFEKVCESLKQVLDTAEKMSVEIHLETSLPPQQFADLISNISHPLLKVNYDTGNSSSLGYDLNVEFAAYGSRIGSIHIKDRILGGGTVPLGTGSTDFQSLKKNLKRLNYEGDFILQVARGIVGDEVSLAQDNRNFVLRDVIP